MLLLKRTISPYRGADLLLGVFSSEERLNDAKRTYLEYCLEYDEYAEQAYHDVNLNTDVETIERVPHTIHSPDSRELYVLSEFTEGFGQVSREILHVYDSSVLAHKKRVALEHVKKGDVVNSFHVETVMLDELNYRQPSRWERMKDALMTLDEERITSYLSGGFNVNERNAKGQTLLHALVEERSEVIRHAVSLGIDMNAPDRKGWTFLFYFRKYVEPTERTIELYRWLIQKGAVATPNMLGKKWENSLADWTYCAE